MPSQTSKIPRGIWNKNISYTFHKSASVVMEKHSFLTAQISVKFCTAGSLWGSLTAHSLVDYQGTGVLLPSIYTGGREGRRTEDCRIFLDIRIALTSSWESQFSSTKNPLNGGTLSFSARRKAFLPA